MKKVHIIIYIISISTFVLVGCANPASSNDSENLFAKMYQDCSMNEDLRLTPTEVSYKSGKDVILFLESISNSSVIFPAGFNIQILKFDDHNDKWVEEQNNAQYLPAEENYIIGKNDPKLESDFKSIPINPRVDVKTSLRVVFQGHIYENKLESKKCSGAFTDIVVSP